MHTALIVILILLQLISCVFIGWSGAVVFLSFLKKKKPEKISDNLHRFAVVICARNERHVLPHLLESLSKQDYPAGNWHVYLIADHCTDDTASLSSSYGFVTVYERNEGPETGKGAVLRWGIEKLLREQSRNFDALMVFDADNIARPDFMSRINDSLNEGNLIVQGYRIAGEPYRSLVTQWYAVYWPLYFFVYSQSREKLRFSSFLTGTGFAVKRTLLEQYGWKTHSITEDVEYAFQECLRGGRTSFCREAVCYDEQPSTLSVMLRQLARWCTGNYQILFRYFGLWLNTMKKKPSAKLFDNLALLLTGPCSCIVLLITIILALITGMRSLPGLIIQLAMFAAGYLLTVAAAFAILHYNRMSVRKLWAGALTFPLFLYLYTFCSLYSLFFPQKRWKTIRHSGLTSDDEAVDMHVNEKEAS